MTKLTVDKMETISGGTTYRQLMCGGSMVGIALCAPLALVCAPVAGALAGTLFGFHMTICGFN